MLRALLLTIIATVSLAACGGGGDDDATPMPEPTPITDPTAAVKAAAFNTARAGSYHMDIAFSPVGEDIPYYVDYDAGDYFERLPATLSPGSEVVYPSDGYTYKRDCTAPDACGAWQRQPNRPVIPSFDGAVNSLPETLGIVAADVGTDWIVAADGGGVKLAGAVNLNRAIQENQRRAFAVSGYTQEQIEAAIQQLWGDQPEVGPSLIEVTLTPDYKWITRVMISVPTQQTDPYFVVQYSEWGEVTVSAPEGF